MPSSIWSYSTAARQQIQYTPIVAEKALRTNQRLPGGQLWPQYSHQTKDDTLYCLIVCHKLVGNSQWAKSTHSWIRAKITYIQQNLPFGQFIASLCEKVGTEQSLLNIASGSRNNLEDLRCPGILVHCEHISLDLYLRNSYSHDSRGMKDVAVQRTKEHIQPIFIMNLIDDMNLALIDYNSNRCDVQISIHKSPPR